MHHQIILQMAPKKKWIQVKLDFEQVALCNVSQSVLVIILAKLIKVVFVAKAETANYAFFDSRPTTTTSYGYRLSLTLNK